MKNRHKYSKIGLALIFSVLIINSCNTPKVTKTKTLLYPAIQDLSEVTGLEESTVFDLAVNGLDAFVYRGFETRDEFEWYGDAGVMVHSPSYRGVSYCNFVLGEKAELIVSTQKDMLEWDVKPTISGVEAIDAKTIKIPLEHAQKFVVSARIDSTEWDYFIISAEEAETNIPDKNDPSVLWLDPGVHKFGQAWDPFVNGIKTVYLAGGAVVEATIKAKEKENIKILGRGLFAQAFVTHAEEQEVRQEQEWDADWLGIHIGRSRNIEIDGIAILNAPSFQLEVADCDSVSIKNVKLCGFGEHNNDGLHTYGRKVWVDDCFIACNDDRICITGLYDDSEGTGELMWDGTTKLSGCPVSDITITNMVFLGLHNNGGDIMLTWNGAEYAKNITIENIVSIAPTNKAFLASMHGGSAIFSNIKIKNVHLYHGNLLSLLVRDTGYQGAGGGAIKDILLENITLDVPKKEVARHLTGFSAESNIEGIVFKNVKATDGFITDISETRIVTNEFVAPITIITE